MNIPELSTALANIQLADQVSIAVLDKAMETSEASGASLIQMMDRSMELSVNPHIGSNFDMSVQKALFIFISEHQMTGASKETPVIF